MELLILYEEGNYILTCYALMDTGRFSSQPLYTSINVPIYNNLEEKPEELEKLDYPQPPIENINHEDSFIRVIHIPGPLISCRYQSILRMENTPYLFLNTKVFILMQRW